MRWRSRRSRFVPRCKGFDQGAVTDANVSAWKSCQKDGGCCLVVQNDTQQ